MKIFFLFLLLFLANFFDLCAKITQAATMKEIINRFEHADEKTLALFDIDMVLIQPEDPVFQMANMKKYRALLKQILQKIPKEKKEIFLVLTTIYSESILIDENTPFYLQILADKKIPCMALTANLTGTLAHIPNIEDWKYHRLVGLGIDFCNTTPTKEWLKFHNLPSYRGNYSCFTNGIIFANGSSCNKGEILVQFLKDADLCFSKIIFIDDREDNIKDVESVLFQYNPSIEYEGIHYLGAEYFPSKEVTEQEFIQKWEAAANQALEIN